jgi:chaperone required for assembly of F1-ATPase
MTTPKRFYKSANAVAQEEGYLVWLDERTLRTPRGAVFAAPTYALAEAIAREWNAQGEQILPASMPLTQLAFASVDWTSTQRDARADYVASFAETDLCCHRAERPVELAERQAEIWDPLVAWGQATLGVALPVVAGVIAAPEAKAVLPVLANRARAYDDFRLTALAHATGLSGSALIGFALVERFIDAEAAFAAAALDDLWSLETWGEDAEARARLCRLRRDLDAAARFIEALNGMGGHT